MGQEQNQPSSAFPGSPACSWCSWLQGQLCICQCFVTLLLSNSCFMWQMTHLNYECCLHSLCLKKAAMSKYNVFLCLYSPFILSVCKVYEGETNHSSLEHTYPHRSWGAAWYGEQNSVIPFLGFFSHRIFIHILSVLVGVFCHEASQILTRLPSKVVSSPSLEILRT